MAYRTLNPSRFSLQNTNTNSGHHIQFLRSGFQQPSSDNSLSNIQGIDALYTAEQVVNRYIVRSNIEDPSFDVFPSAHSIIEALNSNQWIRATAQDNGPITIHDGFYFDLTIVNQDSDNTITLIPGPGVTIGLSGSIVIGANNAVVLRVQILNASDVSPIVYLNLLTTEPTPSGLIQAFGGSSAPPGYLLCNGQAVSREIYSSLFSVVGETYGVGDGLLTFNVPDLRGRIPVGLTGSSAYFSTLGGSGGVTDVTLTTAQLPVHSMTGTTQSAGSHTHLLTDPGHSHTQTTVNDDFNSTGTYPNYTKPSYAQYDSAGSITWTQTINSSTTGITVQSNGSHTHDFTSQPIGSGQSHVNVQPYLTINYIIKV
jgi:microcystin-dependent protein